MFQSSVLNVNTYINIMKGRLINEKIRTRLLPYIISKLLYIICLLPYIICLLTYIICLLPYIICGILFNVTMKGWVFLYFIILYLLFKC